MEVWLVLVSLLLLFLATVSLLLSANARRLPPGPLSLPVIGHFHLLINRPPLNTFFTRLAESYGPIVALRFGSISLVVASSKEAAKAFLKTHDNMFASRPPSTLGRVLFYNRQTMGRAPYGERLRQLRKLCITELFSPRKMDAFKRRRIEDVKSLMISLTEHTGEVVDVRLRLYHTLFNIVSEMLISKRYFGEGVNSDEATEFIAVMNDISLVVGEMFSLNEFFPWLKWLNLDTFEGRVRTVANRVDCFLESIVKERMRMRKKGERDHGDFLDLLLHYRENGHEYLQGDTVKALLLDLFTGGIDTSAMTMEWALAELIRNPACMVKLQEEINTVIGQDRLVEETDIPNLPYLQACVKEIFRLHPPAPLMVPHCSTEPCEVMKYHIPAGTIMVVNVYAIGRDPSVWKEPLKFNPERFLGSQVDVRGQDFELLPFGSGRRVCPGVPLALTVVQLLLANLVHGFHWQMPPGKEVDTTEKYGLLVILANKLEAIPLAKLKASVFSA